MVWCPRAGAQFTTKGLTEKKRSHKQRQCGCPQRYTGKYSYTNCQDDRSVNRGKPAYGERSYTGAPEAEWDIDNEDQSCNYPETVNQRHGSHLQRICYVINAVNCLTINLY